MMKKIVLTTDFSAASTTALNYMLAFTAQIDAELLVLHVNQSQSAFPMDDSLKMEIEAQKTAEAKQHLRHWIGQYPDQFPDPQAIYSKLRFFVRSGSVSDTILAFAREHEVDVIELGIRQKNYWWEYLLGNTSSYLIQHSPLPLFIIPEHCIFETIQHIVFASKTTVEELPVFTLLRPLAAALNASLEKVSIQIESLGPPREEKHKNIHQIYADEIANGLSYYLKHHETDLISLFVPHRSFWENLLHHSVSEELVRKIRRPFLILK